MTYAGISQRCWIFMPRFPDHAIWSAAIKNAAGAAGFISGEFLSAQEVHPAAGDRSVLLVDSPDSLSSAHEDDEVVVLLTPDALTLPPWEQGTELRHEHVKRLTDQICQAKRRGNARLILASEASEFIVELISNVSFIQPAVGPGGALVRALSVFDERCAHWPADLFTLGAKQQRTESGQILDVTGRPRFLVFGPYFTLPSGRWRSSFRISFDEPASRMNYWLDWGGVAEYARVPFRPGKPGMYEISLIHDVEDSEAFEMRLVLTEGAFQGTIIFAGIDVSAVG